MNYLLKSTTSTSISRTLNTDITREEEIKKNYTTSLPLSPGKEGERYHHNNQIANVKRLPSKQGRV